MKPLFKQSENVRRRIIRSFLGLFSLSTMLFVFQACYGTPQDFGQDVLVTGKVISKTDQAGIEGIQVSFENLPQYTTTLEDGGFSLYCPIQDSYHVLVSDEDGDAKGAFQNTDTVVNLDLDQTELFLQISLEKGQ